MKDPFIQGKLSPEEQDQYLSKIINQKFDQALQVRWTKTLKEEHQLDRNVPESIPKKPGNRRILWMLTIAASIAFLLALPYFTNFSGQTPQQLASQYIETEEIFDPRISKGGQVSDEALRISAIEAFNGRDYISAKALYLQLLDKGVPTIDDRYYLGLSALYTDDFNLAIKELTLVQDHELLDEEARWFLALAYLKNENLAQAKSLLKAIQNDDWKYAEAQTLLEKL